MNKFELYHGDCVDYVGGLPSDSIHYSIFSPPFASLYTYSADPRDMGNTCSNQEKIVNETPRPHTVS